MAEVDIEIGGRVFKVACQEGEESHLLSAAGLLDAEATHLMNAAGRLPEPKMLLMAGLMLADKMAGLKETSSTEPVDTSALDAELAEARAKISELEATLAAQVESAQTAMSGLVTQVEILAQEVST